MRPEEIAQYEGRVVTVVPEGTNAETEGCLVHAQKAYAIEGTASIEGIMMSAYTPEKINRVTESRDPTKNEQKVLEALRKGQETVTLTLELEV